uniref:Acyl carrier protein n=1 Tax=Pseudodiaptomus poplesia TaxID=213370 RepID=A0A1S6GL43_9MAXI|nr:mitochondrial acyl carrier [Pseudodiaptomus poplesia]
MLSSRVRILAHLTKTCSFRLVANAPKIASVRLIHAINNHPTGIQLKLSTEHPAWRDSVRAQFSTGVTKDEVERRVLAVCKSFDKISADKVTMTSHFINDLGLDSLDHVEVIMAVEDEFGFEIPDEHAEKLITPEHIAKYVLDREDL